MKEIKVLLVEDNLGDVIIIREMFKEIYGIHFKVTHADGLHKGIKHLHNNDFDILLLDLNLPDSQGLETFRSINQDAQDLPIIILTGFSDEEFAISSVGEGAQDYLVKGQIDSQLLARSIKYAIERKSIERELRKSEEKYRLMVEKIQSGVFLINSQNKLKYVNEAMAKMLGYSVSEMLDRDIFHFTGKAEEYKLKDHLTSLKKRPAQTYELEFMTNKGSKVCFLIATSALFKGDDYLGAISIMTDISARKGMEKSLMEAIIEKDNEFFLIMGSMVEAMKPLIQQDTVEDYHDKFT
jgi:two-component system, NarL family, sensor histidine kinase UhpB